MMYPENSNRLTRRQALSRFANGFGMLGLATMLPNQAGAGQAACPSCEAL